jgi:uncharacterized protein YheU (UPF0270 family)
MNLVEVPFADLSEEALLGVVKAHVLREGTDYGRIAVEFEVKVNAVLSQLRSGKAVLIYDQIEECCHIVLNEEWKRLKVTFSSAIE